MDYQYRVFCMREYTVNNYSDLDEAIRIYKFWSNLSDLARIERREVRYSDWRIFSPADSPTDKDNK